MIKKLSTVLIKTALIVLLLALLLLLAWAFQSRTMPALQTWHTTVLENEFNAGDATTQYQLADYLQQEQQLFAELQEKIYPATKPGDTMLYSRYRKRGPQDPASGQKNWNRSFELIPEKIKGGILLLHGLTDSPYSLRLIGEMFYAKGFYVLGLRLPGHGTVPAALTKVSWKDWQAASRLGAQHVRQQIGSQQPFFIAGYSNGGGLAVKYALDALLDKALPLPDQLLLFSPGIGIAPAASIANSHKLLSSIDYFAQFKWLSIQPEYDPYKYNSFPKNAAQEAWEVTSAIQDAINQARTDDRLKDFPGMLTFLSWTDATVETSATIQQLYGHLDNLDSELIIFDANRFDQLAAFIPAGNASPLLRLKADNDLTYQLTVITNLSPDSQQLAEKTKAPHSSQIQTRTLAMSWPRGIYSLSHVAIPFSPDDPVYGTASAEQGSYQGMPLGAMQPRGETRFLTVPLSQFMRLRHNPFFTYMAQRIEGAINESLDVSNE